MLEVRRVTRPGINLSLDKSEVVAPPPSRLYFNVLLPLPLVPHPRRSLPFTEAMSILAPWLPAAAMWVAVALRSASQPLAVIVTLVAAAASIIVGVGAARRHRIAAGIDDSAEELLQELGLQNADTGTADAGPTASTVQLTSSRGLIVERIARLTQEIADRRALFDAASTPMLATDRTGRVVFANASAGQLLMPRDHAPSRAAPERASGLEARLVEEVFTRVEVLELHAAALRGTPAQAKVRFARADGQWRTLEVVAQPLAAGQTLGVLLTLRDVTELAQADRLKTEFVANASHELRTPLSSIKAAMETLADGAWDDCPMRERLAKMTLANIGRLEALVRDLLDLSRLEAGSGEEDTLNPARFEEINFHAFIEAITESFIPLCDQRRLHLATELGTAPTQFVTEPRLLELILRNLIDNATKFAYENTTIRITAAAITLRSGDAPHLRITVSDQGIGIPLEHQQRVFERFFQSDAARSGTAAPTDSLSSGGSRASSGGSATETATGETVARRRGTGLGLAIVKHAVKSLGGTLSVQSVWKQGTVMTVELPTPRVRQARATIP